MRWSRGGTQRVVLSEEARERQQIRDMAVVLQKTSPAEASAGVALYGLRWWAGEGLSAIARRMGVSDSAVSRRGTVVAQRLREDAQFRSRVERVTNVKLKT
jgi:hypothetical protein